MWFLVFLKYFLCVLASSSGPPAIANRIASAIRSSWRHISTAASKLPVSIAWDTRPSVSVGVREKNLYTLLFFPIVTYISMRYGKYFQLRSKILKINVNDGIDQERVEWNISVQLLDLATWLTTLHNRPFTSIVRQAVVNNHNISLEMLCSSISHTTAQIRQFKGTHFTAVAYREVNNRLTGWAFAHLVNYFAHPVN